MYKLNMLMNGLHGKTAFFMNKAGKIFLKKKNGDAGTIAAVILIVIVVGLLITFRDAAAGWLNTLIKYFNDALNNFTL